MRPELLSLYVKGHERILQREDFLSTYLWLIENVVQSGADSSEIAEIVDRWAVLYREQVEKIYSQHKNLKLAPSDEYRTASDEEKQRMFRGLFIRKLVDAHIRSKRNEAIAEWIIIAIGVTFVVILLVYGNKIENIPTWILIIGILVLFPVLIYLGACILVAQLTVCLKIKRLWKRLKPLFPRPRRIIRLWDRIVFSWIRLSYRARRLLRR
ncbi:MAG: hypothetical protein ACYTFW_05420 [Planctomycetota bacterium]|jgi:hypothetical protein